MMINKVEKDSVGSKTTDEKQKNFDSVEMEWMDALGFNDGFDSDSEYCGDEDSLETLDSDGVSYDEEDNEDTSGVNGSILNEDMQDVSNHCYEQNLIAISVTDDCSDYDNLKRKEKI